MQPKKLTLIYAAIVFRSWDRHWDASKSSSKSLIYIGRERDRKKAPKVYQGSREEHAGSKGEQRGSMGSIEGAAFSWPYRVIEYGGKPDVRRCCSIFDIDYRLFGNLELDDPSYHLTSRDLDALRRWEPSFQALDKRLEGNPLILSIAY